MRRSAKRFAGVLASLFALNGCAQDAASPGLARRWTPPALSTDQYEATPSFSPDGKLMLFMPASAAFAAYQLAQSHCTPQGWSLRQPLPFSKPAPVDDADPFLTRDGRRLYFSSTRGPGEDYDIWTVERRADGSWGEPEMLPEPVNSPHAELLPRMDDAGRLYFGSNRPGGLGKGDIHVATRDAAGAWRVENMGAPVNTQWNELETEVSRDGNTLIVVANRSDRWHLYHYRRAARGWRDLGLVPGIDMAEFQVGPLLSPKADRLLFAQKDGARSGEMFLLDLVPEPDRRWPPACG